MSFKLHIISSSRPVQIISIIVVPRLPELREIPMLVVANDHTEPRIDDLLQSLSVAQPQLNDHRRIDTGAMVHEHFLPRDRLAPALPDHRVHAIHEVPVRLVRREVPLRHPLRHARHLRPARRVHFVSPHMEHFRGEEPLPLRLAQQIAQQRVQRLEGRFAAWIQRRFAVLAGTQLRIYIKNRDSTPLPTHQDAAWPGTSVSATTCTPRALA